MLLGVLNIVKSLENLWILIVISQLRLYYFHTGKANSLFTQIILYCFYRLCVQL